jgi:Chlorophyll A-B binding protein
MMTDSGFVDSQLAPLTKISLMVKTLTRYNYPHESTSPFVFVDGMISSQHRLSSLLYLLFMFLLKCSSLRAPLLSDELGCSPTLSFLLDRKRYQAQTSLRRRTRPWYYFDPLGLATDENFARLREAELKHGRVAMLAMTQVISIPFLKRVDWIPNDFPESVVYNVQNLASTDILRVLATCAFLELFVFVQRDPKDMPGDYGTGYLGLRDKASNEETLVVELENGRLAMLGVVGFLVSDYSMEGQSWLEQWVSLFQRWIVPTIVEAQIRIPAHF